MTKQFITFFQLFPFYPYTPTHNHPKDTKNLPHIQIKNMTICPNGYDLRYFEENEVFLSLMQFHDNVSWG